MFEVTVTVNWKSRNLNNRSGHLEVFGHENYEAKVEKSIYYEN